MMELRQFEGETAAAFEARRDFVLLGPGRSLPQLEFIYCARTGRVPTKRLQTLKSWSSRWGWTEFARQYDSETAMAMARQQISDQKRQWKKELQEFRKTYHALGKSTVGTIIAISKQVKRWAETQEGRDIDPDDVARIESYVKILSGLEKYSDWWSKSIAVDRVLQGWDKLDDE